MPRFHTIAECDGQTDRRTDGQTDGRRTDAFTIACCYADGLMTVAVNRCLQIVAMATSTAGVERSTVQAMPKTAAPSVEHRMKLPPIPADTHRLYYTNKRRRAYFKLEKNVSALCRHIVRPSFDFLSCK